MGFWSGFEGLTGHKPGAFKGFSLKDILDKDMWERRERLNQGRRFEETGVPETTNWYRGRGRPEMMGPRVGAAGVPSGVTPVDPAAIARRRAGGYAGPPVMEQVTSRNRLDRTMPRTQNVPAVAHVSAARPWANIQAQMLRDPLQGVGSMRIPPAELMGTQVPQAQPNRGQFQMSDMTIPPAELMGEKTTVKKVFADPTKSDTVTETIKEKVPMGNMRIPTSELMGARSLAPRRQPTSIMDMMIPIGELMEMRRRRDQMRFRQNPYHMLRRSY